MSMLPGKMPYDELVHAFRYRQTIISVLIFVIAGPTRIPPVLH